MNGDLLTTLDFEELIGRARRERRGRNGRIHRRQVPIDFGCRELDGDAIVGFEEKPTLSYDVSMGVYVFEREAVELVPRRTPI